MTDSDRMQVPDRIGLDGQLDVAISGAKPGDVVTVTAALDTPEGIHWRSSADFVADGSGEVRLSANEPVAGSYKGADANGLLWSLAPDDRPKAEATKLPLEPLRVGIAATCGGRDIGQAEVVIEQVASGVTQVPVRQDGLYGELFVPAGEGPFRPVLVLGGSEGDVNPRVAAFLAANGYLALALGYFGAPGLPPELVDIDIEYFERGIALLRSRPDADGPLAVVGRSRGGELSLLLGLYLGIETVVAYVPSPIVHSGIKNTGETWLSDVPSWRYEGKPVPYMSHTDGKLYVEDGVILCTPTYLDCLDDWDRVEAAMLALEESRSNVLLLSGAKDMVWPSALYSEIALARLRRRRDGRQRHVMCAGAGHVFVAPVLPATLTIVRHTQVDERLDLGGFPHANAAAGGRALHEMLRALAGDTTDDESWT
ncbi:MAG TPA: acyl-CoA thioesterase/bile acid-CoA:amino acid N-acyltransferase family protein [Acidimicrobiales bacterium]|nr:acyl-CoA thioesterase/bile acid-CoA:amino acid N-acyltransferase family protein [Acidimicrobiales bacterium]